MEQPLILDRYRPLGELGQGGYGSVELAWDTRIQRRVAIKRLELPRNARGEIEMPPGLAEARTAAMLSHPNIVQVYDFDTDSDEAFLIMEHVEGLTLRDVLHKEDRLSLDEAAAVNAALSDALQFAHENGVLHLDIKPENILIDARGRIKIADFGISTISTAMGYGSTLTGTLGYMPPEQLTGRELDERTDQWAFASVMFEALSGENLFSANTSEKSLARIHAPYLTPITNYRSDLPREADTVFEVALDPEPENRYAYLGDFSYDLSEMLGNTREGIDSFAILVEAGLEDEEAYDALLEGSLGLWDRIPYTMFDIGRRFVGGLCAGFMAYLGLSTVFTSDMGIALWATVAVVGIVCAFVPQLGSLLALASISIGLFATQSYYLGVTVALVGLLWWWFFARYTLSEAVLPLLGPILTLASISPVLPLLSGFCLPIQRAVPATIMGSIFAFATSVLLSRDPLTAPMVYIALFMLAGAVVATIIVSLASGKASRSLSFIGTILGAAILLGSYFIALKVVTGTFPSLWPASSTILSIALSSILMLIICVLGAPLRSEEEA